jgi:hypothetical protein
LNLILPLAIISRGLKNSNSLPFIFASLRPNLESTPALLLEGSRQGRQRYKGETVANYFLLVPSAFRAVTGYIARRSRQGRQLYNGYTFSSICIVVRP